MARTAQRRKNFILSVRSSERDRRRATVELLEDGCLLSRGRPKTSSVVVSTARIRIISCCLRSCSAIFRGNSSTRLFISSSSFLSSSSRRRISSSSRLRCEGSLLPLCVDREGKPLLLPRLPGEDGIGIPLEVGKLPWRGSQ